MKYLDKWKVFEGSGGVDEYNSLMGKLLHLYGSIPVPKEKSSVVISKIIFNSMGKLFTLGENVDINFCKLHDRIRFSDYFDSLLEDKDVRGHNFEGLVCGLFGGDLSLRGAKWDVTLDGSKYSVKFVDNKGKAPEIGRFKYLIESKTKLNEAVIAAGGLTRVFKSDDKRLKKRIWNVISTQIDGWLLSYPDNIENPTNIVINKIDKPSMFSLLNDGCVVAPKGGYGDYYSLALSSTYLTKGVYTKSVVKIPRVTLNELREEYNTIQSEAWATDVFGEMGSKIRPDVLRWIRSNKDVVIKRLKDI